MPQLGDSGIFLQQKTQNDPKNFMGSTTHASSQRRFHEIFGGRIGFFVVQKRISPLPVALIHYAPCREHEQKGIDAGWRFRQYALRYRIHQTGNRR